MKKLILFIACFFLLMPLFAHAEDCYMVTGCNGLIGWFRVNKFSEDGYDKSSNIFFGTKRLPPVNAVITIKRRAWLRQITWHDLGNLKCHDLSYSRIYPDQIYFNKEEKEEQARCTEVLDGTGLQLLTSGTKVRILGYHQSWHLFVLVQIIKSPDWKNEPKHLLTHAASEEEI